MRDSFTFFRYQNLKRGSQEVSRGLKTAESAVRVCEVGSQHRLKAADSAARVCDMESQRGLKATEKLQGRAKRSLNMASTPHKLL